MTGVEILSSTTIYNTILPEWWIAIGFIMLFVCSDTLGLCLAYAKPWPSIICSMCIVGAIILMLLGVVSDNTNPKYIEHKVIIDESVSMTEFMDKYEIIDQEGKIYTVRERE